MGGLAYKNRARAKEFVRSFANFELMVAVEVSCTRSGRPLWLLTTPVSQVCLELWDIAGP
jgi:hypothetical protein